MLSASETQLTGRQAPLGLPGFENSLKAGVEAVRMVFNCVINSENYIQCTGFADFHRTRILPSMRGDSRWDPSWSEALSEWGWSIFAIALIVIAIGAAFYIDDTAPASEYRGGYENIDQMRREF